jgi:thioesterase domain-containing protein
LEMARQLQQQGEQVDLLALIDSYDLTPIMARVPPEQQEASRLAARFHGELPLPEEGRQSSRALQRVLEKNLLAAWKYVPQPYTGSLTLFEASESALREQGGGRFAATREEVHPLQGDHYSILRGPRVEELAARLRDCLERAMLQAESPSNPRRST